nr:fibrocystin-L-like [Penaeus vannamei]
MSANIGKQLRNTCTWGVTSTGGQRVIAYARMSNVTNPWWTMFGRAPPSLPGCRCLPQTEPESDDVAKAHEITRPGLPPVNRDTELIEGMRPQGLSLAGEIFCAADPAPKAGGAENINLSDQRHKPCSVMVNSRTRFKLYAKEEADPLLGTVIVTEEAKHRSSAQKYPHLKFSAQVTGKYLYSSRKRQTKVDLLKTPYMCFALRGNAKNFLRIKVNYQDTYNRSKNIGLTLEHSARFARDKWSYQCLNLQEMAMNSRLKRFIKKGSWIKLFEVEVPEQEAVHETLYVDEVAFVSEPLYVEAERPSVLESLGILVSEVRVTRGEGNRRAFNLTLQSANCAGKYPLLGLVSDSLNATWMEELRTASRASFSIAGGEAEVERIQETNQDVIGSWELAIGGTTIKGLSPSVSASELQTVIERSLGVAGVQVRSGDEQESCGERKWHLEWVALPGRQELLVPSASNLLVGGER